MNFKPVNLFFLLLGFLAVSCVSGQKHVKYLEPSSRNLKRQPAEEYSGGYSYEAHVDNSYDANISCDELFEILNSARPKPDTVMKALELVKAHRPKFFSRYTLIPKSMSLQESSYENPRAVVYGGNGKTVMTFNGEKSQQGYGGLELMCFNELNSSFEFREILFPKEVTDEVDHLSEQELNKPFVISQVNSSGMRDCKQCHMSPARPNWDTYPVWPNVYGAIDDLFFRGEEFRNQFYSSDSHSIKYTEFELRQWNQSAKKGRYEILDQSASDRPNLIAGKLLTILNAKRIVSELASLEGFEDLKVPFAKAFYCPLTEIERDKSFESASGASFRFTVPKYPIDPEIMSMMRSSIRYLKSKDSMLKYYYPIENSNYFETNELGKKVAEHFMYLGFTKEESVYAPSVSVETVLRLAKIKKIVEPLGMDIKNWSMIVNGGYEFEDGSSGQGGDSFVLMLDAPLLNQFFPHDNELKELVRRRRDTSAGLIDSNTILQYEIEICDKLKQKE